MKNKTEFVCTECGNVTVVLAVNLVLISRGWSQHCIDCIIRKCKQVRISLLIHLHNNRCLDNLSKLA